MYDHFNIANLLPHLYAEYTHARARIDESFLLWYVRCRRRYYFPVPLVFNGGI